MVNDKDENPRHENAGPGAPANDFDGDPVDMGEDGVGFSPELRLEQAEAELSESKDQLLRA
jgi:hypothetical protein